MQIVINGTPGMGKTTIAALLAERLGIEHQTEHFDENEYIISGRNAIDWQITARQYEINMSYYNSQSAVFETNLEASAYTFVLPYHHRYLPKETRQFDYVFDLDCDYLTTISRVTYRNRSFVIDEIIDAQARYRGYQAYLRQSNGIRINCEQTPDTILQAILKHIKN